MTGLRQRAGRYSTLAIQLLRDWQLGMTTVLYVEDDDDIRENFVFELRQAGLIVIDERLAEAALRSLERSTPDLLLLDIGMPPGEMSGIEMLASLRESTRWKRLPVIVLSAFGEYINPDI